MRTKLTTAFALVVGLLAVCSPIFAHHGSAAYDNTKLVVLKDATVTKVNWGNPYTLVLFDVKDDRGNVEHGVVEGGAACAVSTTGCTENAGQAGDVMTGNRSQVKNCAQHGR